MSLQGAIKRINAATLSLEKAGNHAASLTQQLLAFNCSQRLERKTLNRNYTIND